MRIVFVLLLSASCAALRTQPLGPTAQKLIATTDDGWKISMVRYPAVGASKGLPVLLCHGISANDRNMDLDEQHSIARWIAAHGRDAYTMSLRGTGGSDHADPREGRAGDFTFDDYWQHDLPAAIHVVQQASGVEQLDYVGHSMGGMVLYAYLSQGGQGIHAAATVGSPTRLDLGTQSIGALLLVPALSSYPSRFFAGLLAPFQDLIDDHRLQRFFYNPLNTTPITWGRLMTYGTDDVSGGVAKQLLGLLKTGSFKSADGSIDFRHDMAGITQPILVVAGRLDRVAPVSAVKDGYRALGGPKAWLLISRAHGEQAEYNHMDLMIGERAGDEVWAPILSFFTLKGINGPVEHPEHSR